MNSPATSRLYYFDIGGGLVALIIIARGAQLTLGSSSAWPAGTVAAAAAFAIALIALITFRLRAYTQVTPWLTGSFAAAAMLAMAVLFWPLHLVWYGAAMMVSGAALAVALVMRTKPWSAAIERPETFRLVALAIGVAFGLGTIEVGLRLAPNIFGEEIGQQISVDPSDYGVTHPYIGYLHRPSSAIVISGRDFKAVHQVDATGFRNAGPWPRQADVVVVGDSVAFGYGSSSDEAWPAIVAKALPQHPLVNLALIGAGPQQDLRVFETFGIKLRPKLLLVGVFAGNDFWDAEQFDLWLQSGIGGNYMVWRDFGRPGRLELRLSHPGESLKGLFNHYVYPVLRRSRVYNFARALRGGADGDFAASTKVFEFEDGQRLILFADQFRSRTVLGNRESRSFQLACDALVRLDAMAREQGAQVLMVLQPSKEEVYLPLMEKDVPDLTRDLRAAFDERGIRYLDLAPAFRERAAAGERLFYEVDGHPNARGYALTAQLLLAHLHENPSKYGLQAQTGDASLR